MKREVEQKEKCIYLAGGCFWGVEAYFKKIEGVLQTTVGYANGQTEETDYTRLAETDHAETVALFYDANRISLAALLRHFFRLIDPLSPDRQGNDIGRQYRPAVFYEDPGDSKPIRTALAALERRLGCRSAVTAEPLRHFIPAEDYHQDYLTVNPRGYCHIDLSLAARPLYQPDSLPDQNRLRSELSAEAYAVTQEEATEAPFSSPFNDNGRSGIYVDIVSKEPLFSSRDQYNAGCGWPSFTKTINPDSVTYREDRRLTEPRTEVRSRGADSHLGHVFSDGPVEQGGWRYCINGAALEFIKEEDMEERRYGAYLADL